MNSTKTHAPRLVTSSWRTTKLNATWVVLLCALATPASAQEYGPEAPASVRDVRDLQALGAKLQADAAAQAERLRHAEEELARVQQKLEEERAANLQRSTEARAIAESTQRAIAESQTVRAGRL